MARWDAAQRAEVAQRRAAAIQLRISGATWQAIADELGYGSRQEACRDVGRALAEAREESADVAAEYRELELERLDALTRAAMEVLERKHVKAVGSGEYMELLDDDAPKLQAVDRLLKIAESRRRLLGLDQEVEQAGRALHVTIEGINPDAVV